MVERRDEQPQRESRYAAGDELCADHPLAVRIEALLLSTDRPMTEKRLADVLGIAGKDAAQQIQLGIENLNEAYEHTGRSFRIEAVAGGYQVLTLSAFGSLMARLHTDRQQSRLSQAALETLSIVAYRQPIMRAEIEAIRGVACGEILRSLMERRLVKISGRAEELGRPMLYGTTRQFLKVFGLANLDDLPAVEGLSREASYAPPAPEAGRPKQSRPSDDDAEADAEPDAVDESAHRPIDAGETATA
jgi:segregation and condensation protein B